MLQTRWTCCVSEVRDRRHIALADGREIAAPLPGTFLALLDATPEQLKRMGKSSADGYGDPLGRA